jgi:SAM-dependent methyltransferase
MSSDPTQKFSSRVEDYSRYRPSYPAEVVAVLERECGLNLKSRVADIGSGTGLLAEVLLRFGCAVTGVEPNAQMRAGGDRHLAQWRRFHSVAGRAEATTLPDASADLVTAAQAFHWFDPPAARAEFQRILTAPGWVALIWNERVDEPGFMAGYEDIVTRYGPEVPHVKPEELDGFFGADGWRSTKLPNNQRFDLTGLRGRFFSSSYAPSPGTPRYEPVLAELDGLFQKFEKDGRVTMLYETEIYFGRLLPGAE